MTMSRTTLNVQGSPGTEGGIHEHSKQSDMCNMRIVDIQYTITVIVYCIVYGRSCDTYTFHLSG